MAFRTTSKQLDGIGHYLGSVALGTVVAIPRTGCYASLYINLRPLADILVCKLRKLSPRDDIVPFRLFAVAELTTDSAAPSRLARSMR